MQFSGMGLMGHVLRAPSFRCISAIVRTVSISIPTFDVPRKKDRYKWIRTWFSFNNSQPDFSMVSIERCVRRCRGRVYEESPYFVIPKKGEKKKKREKRRDRRGQMWNGRARRVRKWKREREEGTNFCDIGRMGEDDEGEGEGRSEDCRGIDRPPPPLRYSTAPLFSSSTII